MRFNYHPTAEIIRQYTEKIKENSFFTVAFEKHNKTFTYKQNEICTANKFDIYVLGKNTNT